MLLLRKEQQHEETFVNSSSSSSSSHPSPPVERNCRCIGLSVGLPCFVVLLDDSDDRVLSERHGGFCQLVRKQPRSETEGVLSGHGHLVATTAKAKPTTATATKQELCSRPPRTLQDLLLRRQQDLDADRPGPPEPGVDPGRRNRQRPPDLHLLEPRRLGDRTQAVAAIQLRSGAREVERKVKLCLLLQAIRATIEEGPERLRAGILHADGDQRGNRGLPEGPGGGQRERSPVGSQAVGRQPGEGDHHHGTEQPRADGAAGRIHRGDRGSYQETKKKEKN